MEKLFKNLIKSLRTRSKEETETKKAEVIHQVIKDLEKSYKKAKYQIELEDDYNEFKKTASIVEGKINNLKALNAIKYNKIKGKFNEAIEEALQEFPTLHKDGFPRIRYPRWIHLQINTMHKIWGALSE